MEPQAVIQLVDVHKTYRLGEVTVQALRGVSLVIGPGEFVAIMGPSGSGKSTLMNVLGCLDTPTRGRYLLAGADVSSLSRDELADIRNRRIGFVFQTFNLLSRTPAIENVELPMVFAGVAPAEQERRAREALADVGLADRAGSQPHQLSGGSSSGSRSRARWSTAPRSSSPTNPPGTSTRGLPSKSWKSPAAQPGAWNSRRPRHARGRRRPARAAVVVLRDGRIRRDAPCASTLDARKGLERGPLADDEDDVEPTRSQYEAPSHP